MTNPTDGLPPEPTSWRLILDEGDGMEVRLSERAAGEPGPSEVALFMSAARASDLGAVLDAYSRIMTIAQAAGEVSGTEDSLQRALRDAAHAATGRSASTRQPRKITDGARLKAMGLLQQARPELSHSRLVSIVDAAAWWLNDDMDHMAMDLLGAVHERTATTVYLTLLGRSTPPATAPSVAPGA